LLVALVLGGAALALDIAVLAERVATRMDGRAHDVPARVTGFVPRLVRGEAAYEAGWRRTLEAAGYVEGRGEGSYRLDGARWSFEPRGGEPVEVVVRQRTVRSLRVGGKDVPAVSVPLPTLSLLTGDDRGRRTVVALSDLPLPLPRAVVAVEDARFHRHAGLDPIGIARAAFRNLRAGAIDEGGSTITQQLAKNMFLSADRNFGRKFQEALIALILEARYGKDRILEAYLNEIYLGQRAGFAVFGIAEAARVWFGKEPAALTVAECALLAGAIHAPNRTVPWKHPEQAKARRDIVLRRMIELEALPQETLLHALREPVRFADAEVARRNAPWFIDRVVESLGDRYAAEALHRDGLEIVTTIDARLQAAAERSVDEFLAALRTERPALWKGGPGPEVAVLALDPRDGAVRAMVGGANYAKSQWNRATEARRQPGSAWKPIVLAAAFDRLWPRVGPGSLVLDAPLSLPGAGPKGSAWQPKNYDDEFHGLMTVRKATEQSRNLPFVRLGQRVGAEAIAEAAYAMGVTSELAAVPSLAIGAVEVTPLELATAYATLANGGRRIAPRSLEGVRDREGGWLERAVEIGEPGIDPRVAAAVTDVLRGVIDDGTAKQVRADGLRIPAAGKTGTTNEGRDTWMIGYTPDLVAVAWVGYDEKRDLGLGSGQAAVPLWSRFLRAAEPFLSGEDFARPKERLLDEPLDPDVLLPPPIPARPALEAEDRERRERERDAMREMR
jgi:penicillin-binding protein 1B